MIGCKGAVRVGTPGTPVQITAPATGSGNGGNPYNIHGVLFQALPGNTGKVYIGLAGLDIADTDNYPGVAAILPIPTTNFLASFSTSLTIAPNALVLTEFWIDADSAEDGVLVTWLRL